jgi:hypothetical protein
MVADTCARCVQGVIKDVATQVLALNIEKHLLATGEEVLAYARTSIVVVVVGNIFLVICPT